MAVVPLFGPFAAVLVDGVSAISLWVIKPSEKNIWQKSWSQLAFNTSMGSISIFIAGLVFVYTRNLLGDSLAGKIVPYFIAAIIFDQLNIWLLAGIVWLQQNRTASLWSIWKANIWAMPISILLISVGGGILSFSLISFGPVGLVIFFLPILLSAIAFRLYLKKMQGHMDNLEYLVQQRTSELEALNKRKDAFLAVLTHDMITPLTSMQLYAEILREDPTVPQEDPQFTETMIRCQKSLLRLLRNILDLEKLNSGHSLISRKTNFNLNDQIKLVTDIVSSEAREKEIQITTTLPSDPLFLYADQDQFERILLNLLSNAVKYTAVKGVIKVLVEQIPDHTKIEVSDNGYGIPEEELPFIFQRFTRVAQLQDKATGTGLGLAITKALITAHDGKISVRSEIGKGSTFTILLPEESTTVKMPEPIKLEAVLGYVKSE
jgi:signal transduction histidine kinase